MTNILDEQFFSRPTRMVARELLGCLLCRRIGKRIIRFPITEVEAYDGPYDKASHAHRGETRRNEVMFGEAGRWYVYFVYGNHFMLNIVTGAKGYPAAVLIRGVLGVSGPGRVTRALHIGRTFNGAPASRKSGLWIEKRAVSIPTSRIIALPRVGVAYAGPVWSKKLYRFLQK